MEPILLCRTLLSVTNTFNDEADWALASTGDGEAFGRVFDRWKDRVRRHALRLVPSAPDADDAAAIVFFEAWRHRESVRFIDGSMLPWLLVTTTNVSRNLTRSARRYDALIRKLPKEQYGADPLDALDEGEAQQALRGLTTRDQHVITLCVIEGYSEKEAASLLRIPPGTVKSRLNRAKARLTHQLVHFPRTAEAHHEH